MYICNMNMLKDIWLSEKKQAAEQDNCMVPIIFVKEHTCISVTTGIGRKKKKPSMNIPQTVKKIQYKQYEEDIYFLGLGFQSLDLFLQRECITFIFRKKCEDKENIVQERKNKTAENKHI